MTNLYASGEEPRVGDVVRRSKGSWQNLTPGDVAEVRAPVSPTNIFVSRGDSFAGYDPINFTLIARAGEQVTFQPGDVVECVEAENARPWPCTPPRVGDRLTVETIVEKTGPHAPRGAFYANDHKGYRSHCFRLVHRPDAPVTQQPAPTTAEIADSLRHGDRIRIVVEATVDFSPNDPKPIDGWWLISEADVLAGSIEILSRAPEPPVGQLTTTEGLLPGDVLVCTTRGLGIFGDEVTVRAVEGGSLVRTSVGLYHPSHFQFVRRAG